MDREARQWAHFSKRKLSRKHLIRGSYYNKVIFEQRFWRKERGAMWYLGEVSRQRWQSLQRPWGRSWLEALGEEQRGLSGSRRVRQKGSHGAESEWATDQLWKDFMVVVNTSAYALSVGGVIGEFWGQEQHSLTYVSKTSPIAVLKIDINEEKEAVRRPVSRLELRW